MATFLSLPNELLQRVTSYLPFSSLLKLQYLNKRLHGICNDRLVLQDVAQHCFSNNPGAKESLLRMFAASSRTDLDTSQLEWLEGISILGNATMEEAKYLAYAAQRCTEAVLAPASQKKWASRVSHWNSSFDVSEWLPQLLALHHPATLALEPDVFLYPLTEAQEKLLDKRLDIPFESISAPSTTLDVEEAEFINLHFTICYVTLQRLGNIRDSAETTRQFEEYFCPPSSHPDTALGTTKSFNETIRLLCDRVTDYPNGGHDFNQSQAISWILPLALRLAVQFPAVGDYGSLPKPSKIPFHEFMNVKSFYPAGDSFSACHIRHMTSPNFLTGKWMGSYTDERRRRGISQPTTRYDPFMRDIEIIAQAPSVHESDTQGISATIISQTRGIDAHGPFILQGNVYSNGNVELAKLYINHQWAWMWKGCTTPFGIVGEWSGHGRYGGHFWIWKQDWH